MFIKKINEKSILNLISGTGVLKIDAICRNYSIFEAQGVFNRGIDYQFMDFFLNQSIESTGETSVQIFEIVRDSTFLDLFNSFEVELELICLTKNQIINFCIKYPECLRQDDFMTFFLGKTESRYFIAGVFRNINGLSIYLFQLNNKDVILNSSNFYRVVVPEFKK